MTEFEKKKFCEYFGITEEEGMVGEEDLEETEEVCRDVVSI